MEAPAGASRRLEVLTRHLTSAAVDEPALLQAADLASMCPNALQAVLLHDNGGRASKKVDHLLDSIDVTFPYCKLSDIHQIDPATIQAHFPIEQVVKGDKGR